MAAKDNTERLSKINFNGKLYNIESCNDKETAEKIETISANINSLGKKEHDLVTRCNDLMKEINALAESRTALQGQLETAMSKIANIHWEDIKEKPETYKPSEHSHDEAYPSKTGERASGTWNINIKGKAAAAGKADIAAFPEGFASRATTPNWGKANQVGECITDWHADKGGDISFRQVENKEQPGNQQLNLIIDGQYYANEGNALVLNEYNFNNFAPTKTGTGASGSWNINITGKANTAGTADMSNVSWGRYTGNGGQQPPSYFGKERAGFLMSNPNINGHTSYKNWLYMDNYNGTDAGGASAIGVARDSARAFIMSSDATRSSWNWNAELLSTANYNNYAPTKTGGGASGTWNINVNGKANTAEKIAPINTKDLNTQTGTFVFDSSSGVPQSQLPNDVQNYDWVGMQFDDRNNLDRTQLLFQGAEIYWRNCDIGDPPTTWTGWKRIMSNGVATQASYLSAEFPNSQEGNLMLARMGTNDGARIRVGGKDDKSWLEIATGDNGNEPIYVRQYDDGKEAFSSVARTAVLLNEDGDTVFPQTVRARCFNSPGTSTTWVDGRNQAPFKMSQSDGQYKAAISAKTKDGSWDFGTYTDNTAHFSYITDDNYNKKNNAQTCDIMFKSSGEIQANAFRGALHGTADNANKLTTARNIALFGAVTGNVNFDGTGNVSIATRRRSVQITQGVKPGSNVWYKVAWYTFPDAWIDANIMLMVRDTFANDRQGILSIRARAGKDAIWESSRISWLVNNGYNGSDFILLHNTAKPSTIELWTRISEEYMGRDFVILSEGNRADADKAVWALANNIDGKAGLAAYTSGMIAQTSELSGQVYTAERLSGFSLFSKGGVGTSYGGIPYVNADGVMEVGKYIDFHATNNDGKDYTSRFTAETNGTVTVGTINGKLNGDITGFGQPRFNNGTWYNVGDDVKIGDFNRTGLLGIEGQNGVSGIGIAKRGTDSDYAAITYDGGNLMFNKTLHTTGGATLAGSLTMQVNAKDIFYQGSHITNSMIRFLDNTLNPDGNGISIGGGGLTIIGSGESATAAESLHPNKGDEQLILASDSGIDIYTNAQSGIATAWHGTIDGSGNYSGNAATASNINNAQPRLANATENNEIAIRNYPNGAMKAKAGFNMASISKAIDFDWYNSRWSIGNLRGGSSDSAGFGFGYKADKAKDYDAVSWIGTDGTYHGSITGNAATASKVSASAPNGSTLELVKGTMAINDYARIAVGGKDDVGWLEIATSDNGNEPIYVRQYNDSLANGSFSKLARTATLLDASGNTSFPGSVTAAQYYTPNWFRAQGNGGIYWEKWGGGWQMTDATWIRSYNNKNVYINTILKVDGEAQLTKVTSRGTVVHADYAEYFQKEKETEINVGDIVALDTENEGKERYVKATEDSKILVGVHTDEYAMVIGGNDNIDPDEEVPVSLMGRVWVNVTGNPKIGDKITASKIPGVGRVAKEGERSIGIVLTKPKNGKIRILIDLKQ